jgi:hypothetical protein
MSAGSVLAGGGREVSDDLLGKTIRTYPKVIVQDVPGGCIREAEDTARPLLGTVMEQWPDGVVVSLRSFPANVWVKAPFTYEVVP